MIFFTTFCFALYLSSVFATLISSRDSAPAGFTFNGTAPSTDVLKLRIALKQNNIDGLIEKLYDVSDPSSKNYRKWLTKDEVGFLPVCTYCRLT